MHPPGAPHAPAISRRVSEATPSLPESVRTLATPPLSTGAFSVLVGTYDTPTRSTAAETTLHGRRLPVYAVDLPAADGTRRRLLVGRYATREEAAAVQTSLVVSFADARVIAGIAERRP